MSVTPDGVTPLQVLFMALPTLVVHAIDAWSPFTPPTPHHADAEGATVATPGHVHCGMLGMTMSLS